MMVPQTVNYTNEAVNYYRGSHNTLTQVMRMIHGLRPSKSKQNKFIGDFVLLFSFFCNSIKAYIVAAIFIQTLPFTP